jgi:hypothetical protein
MGVKGLGSDNKVPSDNGFELKELKTKKPKEKSEHVTKTFKNLETKSSQSPINETHTTSQADTDLPEKCQYALDQLSRVLSIPDKKENMVSKYGLLMRYLDQYEQDLPFFKKIVFLAVKHFPSLAENPVLKQALTTRDDIAEKDPDTAFAFEKVRTFTMNQPESRIQEEIRLLLE